MGDDARAQFIKRFKEVQRLQTQLDQYTDLTDEQRQQVEQALPKDDLRAFRGVYLETAQRLKEQQGAPGKDGEPANARRHSRIRGHDAGLRALLVVLEENLAMRSLNDLATVGVEPPYALLVSLLGVTGTRFYVGRDGRYDPAWYDRLSHSLERDQYHFDEVIFETVPTSRAECAIVMRPILDQMANAGGQPRSPVFDDQGHFIPLAR